MSLTPKGQARRDALLDAVLRVLAREGPGSITHRSVAAEAGVPLAAATYYFDSLDDLYVRALQRATDSQLRLFEHVGEHDLAEFARLIHEWVYADQGAAIASYELMFLAMRREALRPEAQRWYRALEHAIDPENLHPERTRVIALAVDGLLLRMLWLGEPATIEQTQQALTAIVAR